MFKQMNEIVYAQGEIVDRIDYNINKALDNVSTGVVELQEVFINWANPKRQENINKADVLKKSSRLSLLLLQYWHSLFF